MQALLERARKKKEEEEAKKLDPDKQQQLQEKVRVSLKFNLAPDLQLLTINLSPKIETIFHGLNWRIFVHEE